jgi:DnaD/phage-associated family protein
MAGKRDTPGMEGMSVRVRMGVPALEAGYTLVPNLLLDHYETLGLTEGTALFVIHLLRQGAEDRGTLPDSPRVREHLEALQDRGLLFVRRWPDGVELCLDSLFHNLARLATWLAGGGAPDDFKLQVPADMLTGAGRAMDHLGSDEFEAEVCDVLAAFAAANRRPASPAEKDQIRNLAARFDAAARAADEASNGAASVMAALRSVLDRKGVGRISVPDLEQTLEGRMSAAESGAAEPAAQGVKAIRREVTARVRQMGSQEKEALETVIMAYRGISGRPLDDRLILTLMRLADEYGPTWVLNAIHETGKVQQLISPEYVESILLRWRSEGRIPGTPATAESLPVTDPLLARVVALYEQEVGQLTPQAQAQLLALTQEFRDVDEWQHAFAEAAKSNARNLRYVEAVLRKKGKKPTPSARRSAATRRRSGERAGVWTEEELDAARREALSEAPIDVESFLGEEA